MSDRQADPLIEAHGVTVRRGGRALIQDVDLRLAPGECLALLGPNGAGKSTLLRTLAGELAPDAGSILFANRPLAAWPALELAQRRAVLSQSIEVPFAYRGAEIVALGRFPFGAGVLGKRDCAIVEAALRETQTLDFAHRSVTTLSGGERARLHAARVLAQLWDAVPERPCALFLDEPTAALDLKHQRQLLASVRRFAAQRGIAVLAVLHDVNLAAAWADRIAWMRDGRLLAAGSVEAMVNRHWLVAVYDVEVQLVCAHEGGRPHIIVLDAVS
ncbi:MAG: heme ABC transporter ATP-binding protein [Casimicrobiaceae bacterium]|nr:heme ABC transporter ATP-binding protein [Casimicrobiaceae bacterium]